MSFLNCGVARAAQAVGLLRFSGRAFYKCILCLSLNTFPEGYLMLSCFMLSPAVCSADNIRETSMMTLGTVSYVVTASSGFVIDCFDYCFCILTNLEAHLLSFQLFSL